MKQLKPFIESFGQGPDLVLLHGWGLHSGIWNLLLDDLSKHYRVNLIDLPGFGRSPIPSGEYNLDMICEQIIKVAPEKAHYVGWSLGGLVATSLALKYPERVDKLILVSSNPKFVQADNWLHAMKPNIMDSFCRYLEEDYKGTIIRFLAIQAMGSQTQKEDIKYLKETVFIHGTPATKALRNGLKILNEVDLRQQLSLLEMPTLRLYGRLDSLVPVKAELAIKALHQSSQSKIYPKASHAPFLTNREEFTHDIIAFLQGEKNG